MKSTSIHKGFLAVVAAAGWFAASNALATDIHQKSQEEGDSAAVSERVISPATVTPHRHVIDSEGKRYLLIPLEITDGRVTVEYLTPYTMPMSH